jgi:hypothetical protein
MEIALMACHIQSFLSSCWKDGIAASEALRTLFQGYLSEFMDIKKNG